MTLQLLDVPDNHKNGRPIYDWEKQNIEACRRRLTAETFVENGALHWKSNDSPVPPHVFDENFVVMPENQQAVYDTHTTRVLNGYRKFRENNGYSEEERMEMRNAFGSEPVVDVITGKTINL